MTELSPAQNEELISRIRVLSKPLAVIPTEHPPRLRALRDLRAVLFDVYGTLVISGSGDVGTASADDDAEELAASLASAGFTGNLKNAGAQGAALLPAAIRAVHERRHAEGVAYPEVDILAIWATLLERLVVEGELEGEIAPYAVARLAVEYECRVNPVWPMPGALDMLRALHGSDLALGIVSNAQFYTPLMLEALFDAKPEALGFASDLCAWSYRVGEAKPSPRLFDELGAGLSSRAIKPAEALYVGNDMLNDVSTAAGYGFQTALFAGDRRSLRLREADERCRGVAPDLVINELTQLTELVR